MSINGAYVFCTGKDGSVYCIDVKSGNLVSKWKGEKDNEANSMYCSIDDEYLFITFNAGKTIVLKIGAENSKKPNLQYASEFSQSYKGRVSNVVISPDNLSMFTGDSSGGLLQYSMKHQKLMKNYGNSLKKEITSMYITRNSKYLFLGLKNGHLVQFSIPDQKLVKKWGKVCKFPITSVVMTSNGQNLMVSDRRGNIAQIDVSKFIHSVTSIDAENDFLSPLSISYFSLYYNLNLSTSIILKAIEDRKIPKIKKFFINDSSEIIKKYRETEFISTNDIITMIYALYLTGLKNRIRTFLDAVRNNPNVSNKCLNHISEYILQLCSDLSDTEGNKLWTSLGEYSFKKINCMKKASSSLIKKKVVSASETLEQNNIEHLCSDTFLHPPNGKPNNSVDVFRFNMKVNLDRPSEDFYGWINCIHKYSKENSPFYTDKKCMMLIDYLWGHYKGGPQFSLWISLIPIIMQFSIGFFMRDLIQEFHFPLAQPAAGSPHPHIQWAIFILSLVIVIMTFGRFLKQNVFVIALGPKKYFKKIGETINYCTIIWTLIFNSYLMVYAFGKNYSKEFDVAMLDFYAVTIMLNMFSLMGDLNATQLFRRLNFNLVSMIGAVSTLFSLMFMMVGVFTQVFLFTQDLIPKGANLFTQWYIQLIITYDTLYNHWSWYGKSGHWREGYEIFYFFLLATFLQLVMMKYILAFATGFLKKRMALVNNIDCMTKFDMCINMIEYRRILMRKRNRDYESRSIKLVNNTAQGVDDMQTESSVFELLENDEVFLDYPTDQKAKYIYIVVEKDDSVDLKAGQKNAVQKWNDDFEDKLIDMKKKFDLLEDMNHSDEEINKKFNLIAEKLGV